MLAQGLTVVQRRVSTRKPQGQLTRAVTATARLRGAAQHARRICVGLLVAGRWSQAGLAPATARGATCKESEASIGRATPPHCSGRSCTGQRRMRCATLAVCPQSRPIRPHKVMVSPTCERYKLPGSILDPEKNLTIIKKKKKKLEGRFILG